MRVLLVGPFPPTTGGVTTFLLNLMRSPLARDVQFVPFTTTRPPKRNVAENWGYRAVLQGGPVRLLQGAAVTLWHLLSFPVAVATRGVDLVQVQASDYLVFWEAAAYVAMARLLRRPVLLRIGGAFDVFHGSASPRAQRLIARVLTWPDVLIAQSAFAADYFRRLGRTGDILILPNWVDTALVRRRGPRQPEAVPTFLFIGGSEAKRKGVEDLLAILPDLQQGGARAGFRLLALTDALLQRLAAMRLPGIVAESGMASHAAVLAAMQEADVFLLPSYGEGFPNALIEAMGSGLPAIVTPVGAVPEIVRDGGALQVPVGDRAALAAAIRRLSSDPALRQRLGQEAAAVVADRFVADAVLSPLAAAYRRLLDR